MEAANILAHDKQSKKAIFLQTGKIRAHTTSQKPRMNTPEFGHKIAHVLD